MRTTVIVAVVVVVLFNIAIGIELLRIEATKRQTLDKIEEVTDPESCESRRSDHQLGLIILDIKNDNRRIHGIAELPIPPLPPPCPEEDE